MSGLVGRVWSLFHEHILLAPDYFRDSASREAALQPLLLLLASDGGGGGGEEAPYYDVAVRVAGGGVMGQAQAVRTALARALLVRRPQLAAKAGGLAALARWDGRVVERKKPGRAGARAGFTWVKR
ncbi:37S ribosomal protein S9, mitochondrial [Tetrabaena socialis]|uniref:Small ribosomal subunit protein uS9c n=1 Tax=Tetrabaena socialis TaxID=47790 RepID=A0A2J8AFD9_9CHLO|nr:37S ribosomal protein S9, mitochondrial [Tetrabaena socialis]|eukprot:PNH11238.1 37S ribosomal protein S9, mitochondrial [Tetrabaena socialis]